jgi:hypothetical protein
LPDERTTTERILAAEVAAHIRWANEPDRTAATAKTRNAFLAGFEAEVDPDGLLDPERAKRAANARAAHFKRMALASVKARRLRATG